MTDVASQQLAPWQSFYVIVGSSAAALIGVQFVVMALIANRRTRATAEAIRAFATPNVVHLGAVSTEDAVDKIFHANFHGTYHVFDSMLRHGVIKKRLHLKLNSEKIEGRGRVYRITA